MPKTSKVTFNLDKLKELAETLKQRPSIQVGVFAGKDNRKDAETNATLAAIHEFGAPEANIPARSMLRVPIKDHANKIMGEIKGKADWLLANGGPMRLWKSIGIAAENVVDDAFATGGFGKWAPLKYATLLAKLKGSLKKRKGTIGKIDKGEAGAGILIDTAQLRRSFSSRVRMRI